MIYIGVDGGGTKTAFAAIDEMGKRIETVETSTFAIAQCGAEESEKCLEKGFLALLDKMHCAREDVAGVCLGVPCWGETTQDDQTLEQIVNKIFGNIPVLLCNDVEVAWAGALGLMPGIIVVAGTGTIAFGKNQKGETARCGGWSEFCADQGSGYWLGKNLIELFCKQSDGRIKKGSLYDIVKNEFSLENDFEIINIVAEKYIPYRNKVASLQMLLWNAAQSGDPSAILCYRQAAEEIVLNVLGIQRLLGMTDINVSYAGGVFRAGQVLMDPFEELIRDSGCHLKKPLSPPWSGAIMMAANTFGSQKTSELIKNQLCNDDI